LTLRVAPVIVDGLSGDWHVGPPGAIGLNPSDTPLIERTLAHPVHQAHAFDHIGTGTAQIHGLSAGADAIG
jgi:hypothetical protein